MNEFADFEIRRESIELDVVRGVSTAFVIITDRNEGKCVSIELTEEEIRNLGRWISAAFPE